MKHFILTRFNLKNKAWDSDTNTIPKALSEDWLSNRIELFQNYCLPSVRNQTNKNFIWILVLDTDTPEHYKKLIKKITEKDLNIKIAYSDGFNNLIATLSLEIKNNIGTKDLHIITTRLDNDDIIHKDFVETIQKLYEPKVNMIIDLKKGYQLILEESPEIRSLQYTFNPFISLVESVTNFNTVLSKEHLNWKQYTTKHNLFSKKVLWIQLIHDGNHLNQKISYLKRVRDYSPSEFGINIKLKKYSPFKNFLFNLKLLPANYYQGFKAYIKKILNYRSKNQ